MPRVWLTSALGCALALAGTLSAQQEPAGQWIEILEPVEWTGAATRGLTVRERQSVRVVGLVRHPGGVARVLINGARATLSTSPDGATRFVGYVPVTAGTERVEITAYTPDGRPLARGFDVRPVAAEQAYEDPAAAWREAGERWAVVVGVSTYRDSLIVPLRFADDDARAVYDFLVSEHAGLGGFEPDHVALLLNEDANFRNVRTALFTFLKSATEEDHVFIYFAGHGAPDPDRPDELYLLTYDTEADNISGTGFPMEQVQDAVRRTYARDILVVTDACHSAGVGGQVAVRAGGVSNLINASFLDQLQASTGGIAVFTASEANQYSQEGEEYGGGHGIFTWTMLQALRGAADVDGDRIVTLGEMMEHTRDRVRRQTRNAQIPTIGQTAFDRALPMAIVPEGLEGLAAVPETEPPPLPEIFQAPPEPEPEPEARSGAAGARLLSPTGAAVRSLVIPGLGQAYTGRPALGALFFGAAGGALAFGVLSEKTTIECLDASAGSTCPPDQIRDRIVERPYLAPSIGAAAALAVIGAWDAYRAARRRNEAALAAHRAAGPTLALHAVETDGRRVRIQLLRWTF